MPSVYSLTPPTECGRNIGNSIGVQYGDAKLRDYQGEEGTGPPPHSHDWDEAFYVLKGEIHFSCAGKDYACTVGTLVHVPRGTVHGFRYGIGGGQMLEITGAGALAAQMFTAIDKEIPPGPPDIPKLLDVLTRNGVTVVV